MKDLFPEHFPETDEELNALWQEGLFVFDTNALLNLYRYSVATRTDLINVVKALGDKVWLPNRVAEEFLDNRLSTIEGIIKTYSSFINDVENFEKSLGNEFKHPFISNKIQRKVSSTFKSLVTELARSRDDFTTLISKDTILDLVNNIFEGKVGDPYEDTELDKISIEGADRYTEKIPPGYKDINKCANSQSRRDSLKKYGDFIVWKQVIDCARKAQKNLVYITDDAKEDWWLLSSGKTLGARPELKKEFISNTGRRIKFYNVNQFLQYARTYVSDSDIKQESIDETKQIRRNTQDGEEILPINDHELIDYLKLLKLPPSERDNTDLLEGEIRSHATMVVSLEGDLDGLQIHESKLIGVIESIEDSRIQLQEKLLSADANKLSFGERHSIRSLVRQKSRETSISTSNLQSLLEIKSDLTRRLRTAIIKRDAAIARLDNSHRR